MEILSRILTGVILCLAAAAKWLNFRAFVDVLGKYQLFPPRLNLLAASATIAAEALTGVMLVGGWWSPWPAIGALALFVLFGIVVSVNLARGRFDFECGCFGLWSKRKIGWDLVLRNAGLAGLSAVATGQLTHAGEPVLFASTLVSGALIVTPLIPWPERTGGTPSKLVVPFEPTPPGAIEEMLRLAEVTSSDVVYDLGCGDGRIVIAAAREYGARGIGIDLSPDRIKEAREGSRNSGFEQMLAFREGNLFDAEISEATVVTLYLLESVNEVLRPKLLRELRPGTRIVSWRFELGDWAPHKNIGCTWRLSAPLDRSA